MGFVHCGFKNKSTAVKQTNNRQNKKKKRVGFIVVFLRMQGRERHIHAAERPFNRAIV